MDIYQTLPVGWALPPDEVHICRATTRVPEESVGALEQLLSADERRRADRFHFAEDRRRSVIARGWLRRLLGRCLNAHPHGLEFGYGPQGKPALAGPPGGSLSFNLAHSHELVLFALGWNREIGVDVEWVRPMPDAVAIARSHFTPAEAGLLVSSPAGIEPTFFRFWARKEAVIKAHGTGLSTPLDQFDASSKALADTWWEVGPSSPTLSTCFVRDVPSDEGYCAALALDQRPATVRFWQL